MNVKFTRPWLFWKLIFYDASTLCTNLRKRKKILQSRQKKPSPFDTIRQELTKWQGCNTNVWHVTVSFKFHRRMWLVCGIVIKFFNFSDVQLSAVVLYDNLIFATAYPSDSCRKKRRTSLVRVQDPEKTGHVNVHIQQKYYSKYA